MMFDGFRQRASVDMRAEDGPEPVLGMLEDLESQAEGLHLAERAVEVRDLGVAQYAEVDLAGRLHASVGRDVRVGTIDGRDLHGRLAGLGSDWLSIADPGGSCFVALAGIAVVGGLAGATLPEAARPLTSRLSLRAVLRRLATEGRTCVLHLHGGRTVSGIPARVGADFVELRLPETAPPVTVPVAAISVLLDPEGSR